MPLIHIDDDVELIVEDIFNLPSPHIAPGANAANQRTHPVGLHLWNRWRSCHHGTDTLEETAFFSRYNDTAISYIVITGAMRSSNEVGSDGFI